MKAKYSDKSWAYGEKKKKTRQGMSKYTKHGRPNTKKRYIKKYRGQGK